jgi:hypothetical protein
VLTPPSNVLLPQAYWTWAERQPVDGRYAPDEHIVELQKNEVFVFGANSSGFHGAGSAGWAYTGKSGNQYRLKNPLLKARNGTVGHWAVLGQGRGFQVGKMGRSYAICTIIRPGMKRSVPLEEIRNQVIQMYSFATRNSQLIFYVTKSGELFKPSLNGYLLDENAWCYLDKAAQ